MFRNAQWAFASFSWVCLAALSGRASGADGLRPMTPLDVVRREALTGSLTPDGRGVLYLSRPRPEAPDDPSRAGLPRPDLWYADADVGEPRNISREIDPTFRLDGWACSPDGERVAIAARCGASTALWVWDRPSGRTRRAGGSTFPAPRSPVLAWASGDELLVSTLPDDAITPGQSAEPHVESVIARQWDVTNQARKPSRSVLESGTGTGLEALAQSRWTLFDLTGRGAKSTPAGIPHPFGKPIVAPDGHAVAYTTRTDSPAADSLKLLPGDVVERKAGVAVVVLREGAPVVIRVSGLADANPASLAWSLDGKKLAFTGRRPGDAPNHHAFIFDPRSESLADMDLGGLSNPSFPVGPVAWCGGGELAVLVPPPFKPGAPLRRPDWWLVRPDSPPRNLTAALPELPTRLVGEPGGSLLGYAGGKLWRIHADGTPPAGLEFAGDVPGARLLDLSAATGASVFATESREGTSLWVSGGLKQPARRLAVANAHLREVGDPKLREISYAESGGRRLVAWLVLPPQYDASRRWPMVASVYGGMTYPEHLQPPLTDDQKLLAARGYVVLLPSIPQEPGEPYKGLSEKVLAAVDRAVELGVADPERLGLMGHSYGGYTVYGLVTQTDRFRAAVASAGVSDLVSFYGQFPATRQHGDAPLEGMENQVWAERTQGRMGVPLHQEPARYARNSPITYVAKVSTPLLMIHGDMDSVPIQQGEEFFTSLHRRGKRARFVRYWGEGHEVGSSGSQANFLDKWEQIYRWFGEFLPPG